MNAQRAKKKLHYLFEGFDLKYWFQNGILGGILWVGIAGLKEIKSSGEFRVTTNLRLDNIEKEMVTVKTATSATEKKENNNTVDISTIWANLPEMARVKRAYEIKN